MRLGLFPVVIGLALLLVSAPQPAYAYIDPGLGSLIFQGAVAGFVAVAGAWAAFKMKVFSLFRKNKEDDADREKE